MGEIFLPDDLHLMLYPVLYLSGDLPVPLPAPLNGFPIEATQSFSVSHLLEAGEHDPWKIPIPLAFFGGLAFGAIGMFFTGIIPTIDMFNLPIFLFITPMFLFSGTFFPVSNLPVWTQPVALAFPLYHLAELARRFSIGTNEISPIISIGYLTVFFLFFTNLALGAMRKRLIQ